MLQQTTRSSSGRMKVKLLPDPVKAPLPDQSDLLGSVVAKMCRINFLVFQKMELDFDIGPHHIEWYEILKTGDDSVIMAPRDHGKTHSLARAYPIWKAKYDPWVREIVLLGPDLPTATESLEKLKEMLQTVDSLKYLVPPDKRAYFNSKTEVKLSNGVVIRAKGFASPLRGRHPQLIVCDDILFEKNSTSKDARKKTRRRFFDVVYPMRDRGTVRIRKQGYKPQVVVAGTAQDKEDLYHELMKLPTFKGLHQKSVKDDEAKEVLWPDRYDYDALMKIKETVGAISFSKEYQNEPLVDDETIFPVSLFDLIKDETIEYVNDYKGGFEVYLGADFSIPGDTSGDFTAVVCLEFNPDTNEFTLLHYWKAKPPTMKEQVTQIGQMCLDFNVTIGYLEDNMFQRIYSEFFKNSTLPLSGHTVTHSGKNSLDTGILSLRPMFENCRFRFPYKTARDKALTDEVVLQFNGVVKKGSKIGNETYHDDIVMAIWHAVRASQSSKFDADF